MKMLGIQIDRLSLLNFGCAGVGLPPHTRGDHGPSPHVCCVTRFECARLCTREIGYGVTRRDGWKREDTAWKLLDYGNCFAGWLCWLEPESGTVERGWVRLWAVTIDGNCILDTFGP